MTDDKQQGDSGNSPENGSKGNPSFKTPRQTDEGATTTSAHMEQEESSEDTVRPASEASVTEAESTTSDPVPAEIEKKPYDSKTTAATEDEKAAGRKSEVHKKRIVWPFFLAILILILMALLAYFGFYSFTKLRDTNESQRAELDALTQQISSLESSIKTEVSALDNGVAANNKALQNLKNFNNTVSSRLSDVESRTSSQGKRLLAMSDTSRDDWLLAEAEYLLKLANQRIRIERSAEGSEALLEEADNILRDLEDPSLHNLRRAIAKDLAALRLMNKIDVEGLYLSLVALTENIDSLPLRSDTIVGDKPKLVKNTLEETNSQGPWQRIKNSFFNFLSSFNTYITVTSLDEKPEVLAPDSAVYIQQNLRLMLERAQLAVLREQQDIYVESIKQAQAWALRYYPKSLSLMRFNESLDGLKDKPVVQDLPDISESLNLLNEHIKNLHLLKGALVLPRENKRGRS